MHNTVDHMTKVISLTHCGIATPYGVVEVGHHWFRYSAKPLPEPVQTYCQLDPQKQTPAIFESKYNNFIRKYVFENVFETSNILLSDALVC